MMSDLALLFLFGFIAGVSFVKMFESRPKP